MKKKYKSFDGIKKRKQDHLAIAISQGSQVGDTGLSCYRFEHNAFPEIDYDKIDTQVYFLNKKVAFPIFISCMTGGILEGEKINKNLARAAQKYNIPMGVGSQRIAIDHPKFAKIFDIRKYAPDIPVIANLGLVQLNYGYGISEIEKAIKMVDADAIALHINPIQEAIQPEGDRNFENLLPKLEKVVKKVGKPVIVKEVGFGLSEKVIKRLYSIGIKIFDVAGWGGTSWSYIEGKRYTERFELGKVFSEWGIPTADAIVSASSFRQKVKDNRVTILGSGGIRSGLDIAKAISLGADLVGVASPFAKAGLESEESVEKLIQKYSEELKITMFGVGAKNINVLKKVKLERLR